MPISAEDVICVAAFLAVYAINEWAADRVSFLFGL
jgi:hypothetical protein